MKKAPVATLVPDWKSAFQGHAMKSSFVLALTQPMLEFLCATADDVHWDRSLYSAQFGVARPNSWITASHALERRGLIERKRDRPATEAEMARSFWDLTPAGAAVVELLKVAGIFIEADAAIVKKLNRSKP